jgi:DNA-directed RNA polymerase subunit RPC12/RpoP
VKRGPYDFLSAESQATAPRQADFDQLEATELYCPQCGRSVQVKKSLLLILPEGEKYEYKCQICGTTVGDKMDHY